MRLTLLILFCLPWLASAVAKPNVILIYTDDHGWPDIGAQGIYDDLKTPHIDALAASGVRATNGYSTAPQCVPSRAGLLIGKHQSRFGVESNGTSLNGFNAERTIAERLKKAGYATGQIGKWHLGPSNEITDHGFDDVYAKNANRPCHANYTLDGKTIEMQMVEDKLYHLDACSDAALAFIDRHADEPFFLYLAYRAPHVPLDAPKKYLDRFPGDMPERRRQALAMLSSMDDGIGAITADLKKRGLTDKTLIFYIGDNGAPLKIHQLDAPGGGPGWDGSLNKPMNGEKGMLSEGGIRVPWLVSWPGTIPSGQVYDEPVVSLDVAATATALAGLGDTGDLDGVNLIPYLTGEKAGAPHEAITWRWIAQAAVREGDWKLLIGGAREYLYDLEADPGESKNLLAENPEIAKRLRGRLESWASELQPAGLDTKGMSTTWESYYDFYLDGKPAAPLREKFAPAGDTQGWQARNGTLSIEAGALRVQPDPKARRAPFLVRSGIKTSGAFTAKVRLRQPAGGEVGVAWRLDGQKDFEKGQVATVDVSGSDKWQDISIEAPASGDVIHIRLFLPGGETAIKRIALGDKVWRFGDQ